jgi:hypothetical protein
MPSFAPMLVVKGIVNNRKKATNTGFFIAFIKKR